MQNLFLHSLDVATQIIEIVKCLRWLDFCQAKVRYVESLSIRADEYGTKNFEIQGMVHPAIDEPVSQILYY